MIVTATQKKNLLRDLLHRQRRQYAVDRIDELWTVDLERWVNVWLCCHWRPTEKGAGNFLTAAECLVLLQYGRELHWKIDWAAQSVRIRGKPALSSGERDMVRAYQRELIVLHHLARLAAL